MYVDEKIAQYAATLVTATRWDKRIVRPVPPERAAEVIAAARKYASEREHSWVAPEDVKAAVRELFRDWLELAATVLPTERDDIVAALIDKVELP